MGLCLQLPADAITVWQSWTILSCNPWFPVWPQVSPALSPQLWLPDMVGERAESHPHEQLGLCLGDHWRLGDHGWCWAGGTVLTTDISPCLLIQDRSLQPYQTSSSYVRKVRESENQQSYGHLNMTPVCLKSLQQVSFGEKNVFMSFIECLPHHILIDFHIRVW